MNLSDGEKLIVTMLCDIYKALNVKGDVDPELVRSSIVGGRQEWLADIVANGDGGSNGPAEEVGRILEMWSAIERGYKRLSADEKDQVEAEAGPLGRGVRFSGFDNETEQLHQDAARHLIEDLNSFDRFQGRNLGAHMPTLDGYRRMLRLFASIGPVSADARLTVRQIISLANAEKHQG
jgi:uncharacterized protein YfbU (UPF0304 family)